MVPAGTKHRRKTQKSPKAKPQDRVPYQMPLPPPRWEHPPATRPCGLYPSPALGLTQDLNDLRATRGYCLVETMLLLAPGQTQLLTKPGQTSRDVESLITRTSPQVLRPFKLPLRRKTSPAANFEVSPGLTLRERPKEADFIDLRVSP